MTKGGAVSNQIIYWLFLDCLFNLIHRLGG